MISAAFLRALKLSKIKNFLTSTLTFGPKSTLLSEGENYRKEHL